MEVKEKAGGNDGIDGKLAVLVYALMAFLIVLPLLAPGYYLALDMQFGPQMFSDTKFDEFYGSMPSSYGAYFPLKMAMGAVSEIIGTEAVQKLLLFSIIFLCGISAHFSLPKEHGNARYAAGLLYMLNPFVYVRFLAGHWSFLLSYALWPLALLSFLQFMEKPKERGPFVKTALLVTLASISSHGVIILLICFALALVFHTIWKGFERQLFMPLAMLAGAILLMNLYWIAPTLMLFDRTYAPASPDSYLEDFKPQAMGMSLGASLASMHGFWRGGFIYTKDVFPLWWLPFFAILFASALGAIALFRGRAFHALLVLSIMAAGFLLALGDASPVSWMFTMFGEQLPIYMLFRDSQKFVGMLCLGYSILCSYGAHGLIESRPKWKNAIIALVIIVPVLFNFGFFGYIGQIRTTQYPADWAEAARLVALDPSDFNVLILPPYLYNTYSWSNSSQKTLASPAGAIFNKPIVVSLGVMTQHVYTDMRDPYGSYIDSIFKRRQFINNTAELLAPINVKYIVVLKEYADSDSFLWLFKRKGGVDGIDLIYEGESLYLFRNNLAKGPLITAGDGGNASFTRFFKEGGGVPEMKPVSYERINEVTYRIEGPVQSRVVFLAPPDPSTRADGLEGTPWYRLGNSFECAGGCTVTNSIFPVVLGLFLLAWLVALMLLLNPTVPSGGAIAVGMALLSMPILEGSLGPRGIGALLLLSASFSLFVINYDNIRCACKSFLKLK